MANKQNKIDFSKLIGIKIVGNFPHLNFLMIFLEEYGFKKGWNK